MSKPITTPIPEVADRYTIAILKIERLDKTEIDTEDMKRQINYCHGWSLLVL